MPRIGVDFRKVGGNQQERTEVICDWTPTIVACGKNPSSSLIENLARQPNQKSKIKNHHLLSSWVSDIRINKVLHHRRLHSRADSTPDKIQIVDGCLSIEKAKTKIFSLFDEDERLLPRMSAFTYDG